MAGSAASCVARADLADASSASLPGPSLFVSSLCAVLSYTENVGVSSLAAHNKEILENVLRHNGGLITAE